MFSLSRDLFNTNRDDEAEKEGDTDYTNTSDIFEATKRQMTEREAGKASTSNSPLFTSAIRNSSFASFFTTKNIKSPLLSNKSPDYSEREGQTQEADVKITDLGFFEPRSDYETSPQPSRIEDSTVPAGSINGIEDIDEEETRDMTKLFGKIKETALKTSDPLESPMKLSEETASPFRRKSLLQLDRNIDQELAAGVAGEPNREVNGEESNEDIDNGVKEAKHNEPRNENQILAEGDNDEIEFPDVLNTKEQDKDDEAMEFTAIQNEKNSNSIDKSQDSKSATSQEPENNDEMDFTDVGKPAQLDGPSTLPNDNETMDFTSVGISTFIKTSLKRKSILANLPNVETNTENLNDGEEMEFTKILPSKTDSHTNRVNNQEDGIQANTEEPKETQGDADAESMDFTMIPQNGRQSNGQLESSSGPVATVDSHESEEEMDFTMTSHKTFQNIKSKEAAPNGEEEMDFTIISKKPVSSSNVVANDDAEMEVDKEDLQATEMEFTSIQTPAVTKMSTIDEESTGQFTNTNIEAEVSMEMTKPFISPVSKTIDQSQIITSQKTPSPQKFSSASQTPVSHHTSSARKTPVLDNPPVLGMPDQTPSPGRLPHHLNHTPGSNRDIDNDTPTRQSSSRKRKSLSSVPPNKRRKSQGTPSELKNKDVTPISERVLPFSRFDDNVTSTMTRKELTEKILELSPKKKNQHKVGRLPQQSEDGGLENKPIIEIKLQYSPIRPPIQFTPLKSQREDQARYLNQLSAPPSHSTHSSPQKALVVQEEKSQIAMFLDNVGIGFVDSLLGNLDIRYANDIRKRMLIAKQEAIASTLGAPKLEDYAINFEKLPLLGMYKFSTKEMHKRINQSKELVKEMEQDTNEEAPRLFKEFFESSSDKQLEMIQKFRMMKIYARLVARNTWLRWRQQLIQQVTDELEKRQKIRENDERIVRRKVLELSERVGGVKDVEALNSVEAMKKVKNQVKEKFEAMKRRLEKLKAERQKLKNITDEKVEKIKTRYHATKEVLKSRELEREKLGLRREIYKKQNMLSAQTSKGQDLEIARFQKKNSVLEIVSGVKILSCDSSLKAMIAKDALVEIFSNNYEMNVVPQKSLMLGVDASEVIKQCIKSNSDKDITQQITDIFLLWTNMKHLNYEVNKRSIFSAVSVKYHERDHKFVVGTRDEKFDLKVDGLFGVV